MPAVTASLPYSEKEITTLIKAVGNLPNSIGALGYCCGPRAVRLFIYRYQLIRLLLKSSSVNCGVNEIMRAIEIAQRPFAPDAQESWKEVDPRLKSIVQSVV
jgi:hypothetical protein